MGKLAELEKIIAEDFERATEPEQVKRLALQKQLLDEAKKEEADLLTSHQKLKDDYVKSVKSEVVSTKSSDQPKKRSMKEIVKSAGLDKKIKL